LTAERNEKLILKGHCIVFFDALGKHAVSQVKQWTASSSLLLEKNGIISSSENGLYLHSMPGRNMLGPEESTERN
jgi:hypothetical protein